MNGVLFNPNQFIRHTLRFELWLSSDCFKFCFYLLLFFCLFSLLPCLFGWKFLFLYVICWLSVSVFYALALSFWIHICSGHPWYWKSRWDINNWHKTAFRESLKKRHQFKDFIFPVACCNTSRFKFLHTYKRSFPKCYKFTCIVSSLIIVTRPENKVAQHGFFDSLPVFSL